MTERPSPREVLRHLEQRARKRFGQNFLTRDDIVARIVRGAGVREGDRVVEIGPGLGVLTDALLGVGADLTSVELDRDLAAYIRATHPDLRLVEGDALRQDWDEVCPGSGWKVVSNLPFNVGTRLVVLLADRHRTFSSLTVMLQQEVADRILATPGGRTYGALTVQLAVRADTTYLVKVPSSAFYPAPKVDAAVIRLDLLDTPRTGGLPPGDLDRVVRAAFSQRRKTLRNSLGPLFGRPRVDGALAASGIDPQRRAETLSLDEFVALAPHLLTEAG